MTLHQFWQAALNLEKTAEVKLEGIQATINTKVEEAKADEKLRHDLENLKELFTKKIESLLAKPALIRPLFAFLREHDPILAAPRLAVVSTYADVLEVLSHDAEFAVKEIYAAKMERETGAFVLGMENTPQYQSEIGMMRAATKPEDLDAIRRYVAQSSEGIVTQAKPTGALEVVGQLSRMVPARLVGHYFGTPGPDEVTLMRWMRAIFRDIFLNLGNDAGMREEAIAAAQELNAYLNAVIAERKQQITATPDAYDDFLSRLLKMQAKGSGTPDDETIRRILGGTIVGTVDTNSKAIAQALDQLLDRPDMLAGAHEAALADNDELMTKYVFEALRFSPQNPFLIRYCTKAYTVAAGTPRARVIPQGDIVIVGTMSAMFDPSQVTAPEEFRLDRPSEAYLHFGYGQHTCFGRHIASVVIPQVAKSLLRCKNLRRAEGNEGHITYDGAFPDSLKVVFDPA